MIVDQITLSKNGGTQKIIRFSNGYGASIVNHSFSYGTEMAVIQFSNSDSNINNFHICYDTPITDDVLGHLSEEDVQHYLNIIELLPSIT